MWQTSIRASGTLETGQSWVVTGKLKVYLPSPPDPATIAQHRRVAYDNFQRQGPNVDPETIIVMVIVLIVIETLLSTNSNNNNNNNIEQ